MSGVFTNSVISPVSEYPLGLETGTTFVANMQDQTVTAALTPTLTALFSVAPSNVYDTTNLVDIDGSAGITVDTTNDVFLLPAGGYALTFSQSVSSTGAGNCSNTLQVYKREGDNALADTTKLFTRIRIDAVASFTAAGGGELNRNSHTMFVVGQNDMQLCISSIQINAAGGTGRMALVKLF